jgi:DNA-binding Lrp family transcriptional regulator
MVEGAGPISVVNVLESSSTFLVTGRRHDPVAHVVVQDIQHIKGLALDQFTNWPSVTRTETSITFDARRRYELPVFRPLR